MEKSKFARFPKGSEEAKQYMAKIREIAKWKREALAKAEPEPEPEPEPVKVEETILNEVEEKEIEPIKEQREPPKRYTRKPRMKKAEPEPEPEGAIEEEEKVEKEEKPVVVKVPPKKVKKIIIEEEEEEQYEVEYRKAPAKKIANEVIVKPVVNNIKDTFVYNPLLGQRMYRNR